jgi:hypothetical protein
VRVTASIRLSIISSSQERKMLIPRKALAVLACLTLLGCEDGPTQPYNPSPDGAGDQWNDGQTPPVSDPGKQGFGSQSGGGNKVELCPGDQKAKVWANLVKQPIVPPTLGAGLDISGKNWQGLTIDEAEKVDCQSINIGDLFGDGTQTNYWGDNNEVIVDYRVSTRKILFMIFLPGYLGTMEAMSRDKSTKYSVPIYSQILKDGKPMTIDWNQPDKFSAEINEIYDAMIATFAPGLPPDPDCVGSGACIVGNFGDVAYFGFSALGTFLWVDNKNAAQPTPSIFTRVDMYLTKTLPFSLSNPLLKLDAQGPVGIAGKLGVAPAACDVRLGLTFDQFLQTCVKVSGDAKKDQTEYNKLLGGLSHSSERFGFDVQGVDLNFSDKTLPDNDIIHDNDLPHPTDIASEFVADQSTLGVIANDHVNNDPSKPKDLHGAGLVYLEYARLVQEKLTALTNPETPRVLGDPACLEPNVDPKNPVFPDGCTGFEGFITAAPPTSDPITDVLALGPSVTEVSKGLSLGLKPGHPQGVFCLDANGDLVNGYYDCQAPAGANGDIFATSYFRVLQVLGKGDVANLPIDARDIRFFWKQYFTALIKYFNVVGTVDETPDGVHAQIVDPDNLFFDSLGSGQFEIGEYIDRRFASKTQDPTDVVITADVKNGIFNDYDFSREIYRGETALYTAVLENPNDGIGQENTATLTNLFGSPVLKAGWKDSETQTAYYCATHMDPKACDNQLPPVDEHGKMLLDEKGDPILKPYPGAFTSTIFTLGDTTVTVAKKYPNIQSATLSMPLRNSPYDPKSGAAGILQLLVPWVPKQPGVGFPVAITGTIDKFISTSQLDLSGTTISANIDYDYVINPNTGAPTGKIQLLAVETTDFLGQVFLCQDPVTGDLLGARMYTPVAEILDWLQQHPNAYDDCGFVIRYSPYNNYADYITSLNNGVRLGITQGGGFGRVVDVTLFVPGQ